MFGKKKEKQEQKSKLSFESEDYQMEDTYYSGGLVVGNLQWMSDEVTPNGPMTKTTDQKYIFEQIMENNETRYREIFTGFIADDFDSHYFNLPYVVNITTLKEELPGVEDVVHKYGLLLIMNDINTKGYSKTLK
jgi:hypothetical protein